MDIANLAFRTFAHATEDPDRVEKALKFVSGAEEVKRSNSTGYHGNPIVVMEARVTEGKNIKSLFRSLDKDDLSKLLETLDRRLDEESFFFLRLDKQEAYQGRFKMTEGEDVIAVRGKVKSYPQTRENALEVMRKYLTEELDRLARLEQKH
jgi:RNA binding exosome subunit